MTLRPLIRPLTRGTLRAPTLRGGASAGWRATGLSTFTSAMRATQAGVANTRIVLLGDSTTAGFGSGSTDGWITGGYPNTPGPLLGGKFTVGGVKASAAAFFGNAGRSAAQQSGYDSRFTFDDPSVWLSNNETFGQSFWRCTGLGGMNFAPVDPFDTLEVRTALFNNASAGILGVYIDGVQIGTINVKAASAPQEALVTQTFNCAPGVHTVAFKKESGSFVSVLSAYPYLSTQKEVSILIGGRPGGTSALIADDSTPWASLKILRSLAPHLTMICVGLNDLGGPTAQAVFEANLTAMVTAAKVSGDALLVIPNSKNSLPQEAILYPYIQNVATATNTPIIDRRVPMGTWAAATAGGFMFDTTHPNGAGYGLISTYEYARLST